MTKVKLGLRNLNAIQLISKARRIITEMSGNEHFPDPNPTLAAVQLAADELNKAMLDAMSRDKLKISIRKDREAELKKLLRQLGAYVQNVSNSDPLIIKASGFAIVKRGQKLGHPDSPNSLRSVTLDLPGRVKLLWRQVKDAKCYIIEKTTGNPDDPQTSWENAGYVTKSRCTVDGLEPLTYYYFRVMAVGSAGAGPPSNAVRGVALS